MTTFFNPEFTPRVSRPTITPPPRPAGAPPKLPNTETKTHTYVNDFLHTTNSGKLTIQGTTRANITKPLPKNQNNPPPLRPPRPTTELPRWDISAEKIRASQAERRPREVPVSIDSQKLAEKENRTSSSSGNLLADAIQFKVRLQEETEKKARFDLFTSNLNQEIDKLHNLRNELLIKMDQPNREKELENQLNAVENNLYHLQELSEKIQNDPEVVKGEINEFQNNTVYKQMGAITFLANLATLQKETGGKLDINNTSQQEIATFVSVRHELNVLKTNPNPSEKIKAVTAKLEILDEKIHNNFDEVREEIQKFKDHPIFINLGGASFLSHLASIQQIKGGIDQAELSNFNNLTKSEIANTVFKSIIKQEIYGLQEIATSKTAASSDLKVKERIPLLEALFEKTEKDPEAVIAEMMAYKNNPIFKQLGMINFMSNLAGYDHNVKTMDNYDHHNLNRVEIAALVAYTTGAYTSMNDSLREAKGEKIADLGMRELIQTVVSAMIKLPDYELAPGDEFLTRSIYPTSTNRALIASLKHKYSTEKEDLNYGFTSTSYKKDIPQGAITLHIYPERGKRTFAGAKFIGFPFTAWKGEGEVLFVPNKKFTIETPLSNRNLVILRNTL